MSIFNQAAELVRSSQRITAFTGAGISVESGIPPFRGEGGLWEKYDPGYLEINYFRAHPAKSWPVIKEIFYDFFGSARPNAAHLALAELEKKEILQTVITQNIDNLHQAAGSKEVYEFHGNSQYLICDNCAGRYHVSQINLDELPPCCRQCGGLLKPDFVFFGETVPQEVYSKAVLEAQMSDLFILIGTTGEVMPAALIPPLAKSNGTSILEINVEPSNYTDRISDIFIRAKATEGMTGLMQALGISFVSD
ncbi:MAG: RNA polymerase subunit sigma [candidate division Zixibacteria bacterium HGW-Zixibacteria-1]|nr:MAG: RNA polymerase subunit sigma [candidate division Zixibacteria bacterium HGW-Zixibacteria-1]